MPWIVWFLGGVLLVIAEAVVPGFFLASLGLASLVTAAASALGATITQQVGAFAVATFISYFGFRRVFEAFFHPSHNRLATGVDALIGREGQVTTAVAGGPGGGRVAVGGDDWRAVSEDGQPIEEGDVVVVTAVTGATLTVRRSSRS